VSIKGKTLKKDIEFKFLLFIELNTNINWTIKTVIRRNDWFLAKDLYGNFSFPNDPNNSLIGLNKGSIVVFLFPKSNFA